ncbi:hypothetical protein [Baaleninema simplex]|nr:hypothetical protein [Baaleninema simplex]
MHPFEISEAVFRTTANSSKRALVREGEKTDLEPSPKRGDRSR